MFSVCRKNFAGGGSCFVVFCVLVFVVEQFGVGLIHDSLIDLLEHEYLDESTRRLIKEMFELERSVEKSGKEAD